MRIEHFWNNVEIGTGDECWPWLELPEVAMQARIHPHWIGGRAGYAWSVLFADELLVSRSTTPEFDAARALMARGITGKLTLLDGKTGRPRLILDIEKCAKLTIRDDARRGPCFVKWKPMPSDADQHDEGEAPAAETASPGPGPAKEVA